MPLGLISSDSQFRVLHLASLLNYVWQSQVEIEHNSVAYFDHVTAFEVLCAVFPLRAGLIRAV